LGVAFAIEKIRTTKTTSKKDNIHEIAPRNVRHVTSQSQTQLRAPSITPQKIADE
jgi:hypothetical protein